MFSIFAQLWVLAFFVHHAEDWDRPDVSLLAMLLVVWTTWARDRTLPLAVALSVVTAYNLAKAPHLANHYTLISACLLAWNCGASPSDGAKRARRYR